MALALQAARDAVLRRLAADLWETLTEVEFPDDGNGFFAATAVQTPDRTQWQLRKWVAAHVAQHQEEYERFFPGEHTLGEWFGRMSQSGTPADDVALRAAARVLRRSFVVWRVPTTQPPRIVLADDVGGDANPVLLLNDEQHEGVGRYWALLRAGDEEEWQHTWQEAAASVADQAGAALREARTRLQTLRRLPLQLRMQYFRAEAVDWYVLQCNAERRLDSVAALLVLATPATEASGVRPTRT